MSKRRKRLERIRRNPHDVSLEELQRVLDDYGFEHKQTVGSHYTFRYVLRGQTGLFVVPFRRPLKPIYVTRAVKLIERIIEEQGEDDSEN